MRPLTAFCIRLCKLNPDLRITLLIQTFLAKKIAADRGRYGFDEVSERFHIIEGGPPRAEGLASSAELRQILFDVGEDVPKEYEHILNVSSFSAQGGVGDDLQGDKRLDSLTGKEVAPWDNKPEAIILDTTLFSATMSILGTIKDMNPKPRVATFLPIGLPAVTK